MTKRSLTALGAVLLVATVGAVAAGSTDGGDGDPPGEPRAARVLEVAVVPAVREAGYTTELRHTGTVRARRDAVLGVETAGRITAVHVDVGTRVRAGDPLVESDSTVARARRAELVARREVARAELAEAEAGPRRETIAAARAAVRQGEKDLDLAKLQVERTTELVARDVASQDELDVVTTRVATLDAALERTRARLEELENGTRAEVLAAARARVAELDATIARLDVEIADATLTAPFDGTIAERHVDEGAVLGIGDPALRLVETAHLEAWFGLPGDAADHVVACADTARIVVRGREIVAANPRVLPAVDGATRTATVVFDLATDDPAATPRPGDVARLALARRVERPGYWLPIDALSATSRGLWSCYVVTPIADASPAESTGAERIARADVEVLHVDGDRAFVRGTLEPGDRVVARGIQRVVPDQRVRAVPLVEVPAETPR